MPVSLLNRLEAAWEVYLQEGYGLTETCSMAFSNPPDGRRIPGSVGLPIRGCEYRIGDSLPPGEVGEVRIRGPVVSSGYFPAAESKERWLHTGDLGYSDPHGYLHLVDRSKDVVVRLGLKVYPREVEEVLLEHSQVKEAAVIGRPYRHFGQSLEAYVVPEATDEKICPEALKAWCQGRLAKHKVPSRFRIVRELPKTTSGKIAKAELRKR
jgi:long-chain acyl-CoA synthetase